MIILRGEHALSEFRRQKLQASYHGIAPFIKKITAQTFYFIDADDTLSPQHITALQQLCHARWVDDTNLHSLSSLDNSDATMLRYLVIPRLGTQSPWSSKAIDIVKVCGFSAIKHIEHGILYSLAVDENPHHLAHDKLTALLHDPLTESVLTEFQQLTNLFRAVKPQPLVCIDILHHGADALRAANRSLGMALSETEIHYLVAEFHKLKRNPTDVEVMMFAQANSEHCRHKIFNAMWTIDGEVQPHSLFDMIRNTYHCFPDNMLSVYKDNAAIIQGPKAPRLMINADDHHYAFHHEDINLVIKVETHNHPTAISPFPGAATGAGGEIRDEGATGRGAKPKAGLCGFSVSNLHIPGFEQAWEVAYGKPQHMASALEIMLDGPIGAASFANEFGRPTVCGYFRSYEMNVDKYIRGYHKPIMIAGGLGNIRPQHSLKSEIIPTAKIIVLGGPAMLIGLGGGAASSVNAGDSSSSLDFASVQRSNPEMQRRCQEVIDYCWSLGDRNPILSIHDVGAGGLSNAIPELLHDSDRGGELQLRAIPNAELGMSPLAIWCNEAQERYVLAVRVEQLEDVQRIAIRERCPLAVVGEATATEILRLQDTHFANDPINVPMSTLFGKTPKLQREAKQSVQLLTPFELSNIHLVEALTRVLRLPAVADKSFLITIADRSVGGLVVRDQMVGPWQIPVADAAVTAASFTAHVGEAMAMGERAPIAIINPAASGRMAVAEAITNIASCPIAKLSDIKLSANWMAAPDHGNEALALFETVKAVGLELCPALELTIPVGKDSLSMRTSWQENGKTKSVIAPLSLVISAFAPVTDFRQTLTPQLKLDQGDALLLLLDLGAGKNRLGGSALAQVYSQVGDVCPDLDNPQLLKQFFAAIQQLNQQQLLLAYHDRSDGGVLVTLCEMAFASHCGFTIHLDQDGPSALAALFSEELGAVIQIRRSDHARVMAILQEYKLEQLTHCIADVNSTHQININAKGKLIFAESRYALQKLWSETSYHLRALRDNPQTAIEEFENLLLQDDPGLHAKVSFDINRSQAPAFIHHHHRPQVAILREQGVNGHFEMAAAFSQAGFTCLDVHMSDILNGAVELKSFIGLAACGGFSYGDVLGAGRGWAQSILLNSRGRDQFAEFFARKDTFTLGVCNGCQMLSQLNMLIPGADAWPRFVRNTSEQFEARLSMVEIMPSASIFFKEMIGSRLPVVISHGEGRVEWENDHLRIQNHDTQLIALRFIDSFGKVAQRYPANPNGSPDGITALTTTDGRATIMMPHPERVFRTSQFSWHPTDWPEYSPWQKLFLNARDWVN